MTYLTRQQKRVFDYIDSFIEKKGYAPSIREICKHFKTTSLTSVRIHLDNLEGKGLIKREKYKSRAIEIIKEKPGDSSVTEAPVLGTIADYAPLVSSHEIEFIRLPEKMLKDRHVYFLRVKGNFLNCENIQDGDLVVIETKNKAEDGDIAVVLFEKGMASLKKIKKKAGIFTLTPPFPNREIFEVEESEVKIQGVVIGVLRDLLD